jgi:hypothetical protein
MAGSIPTTQAIVNANVAADALLCQNKRSGTPVTANEFPEMNREIVTTRTCRNDSKIAPTKLNALTAMIATPR